MANLSPEKTRVQAINEAHEALKRDCDHASAIAIERAAEIGNMLIAQKKELSHGEWIPWVESNMSFGILQANNYMRVSRNYNRGYNLPMRQMRIVGKAVYGEEEKASPAVETTEGMSCTTDDLHELVRQGVKFGTIYADPPWPYDNQGTRAATGNHYGTETVEWMSDPENMPIEALSEDASHLHLWTTNAFLRDAFGLIDAWGFKYKSCFVWCKPQMGIGNYWRVSHEFLLLGVRGGATFADKSLMSWREMSRGKHSEKPEAVRLMIESASPGPNRLELFGRKAVPGWCVWGNEIARDLLTQEIQQYGAAV